MHRPERVEHRRRDLQVLRQLRLALGLERVDRAAHREDVRGDRVAGGVVGAHRGRRVGDADALDRARVVGRKRLVLDDRDVRDAELDAGRLGAVPQDAKLAVGIEAGLERHECALGVAELQRARSHVDAHRGAHLDRVEAEVAARAVELGDTVEVTDAAVGAERPCGLVLRTLGLVVAVLVEPVARALDDAAAVAAVAHVSRRVAARKDRVALRLAADGVGELERARREVAGRQAAGLVEDVGEHVGAVHRQAGAGDRVLLERRREPLGRGVEGVLVGVVERLGASVGDDDALEALAAHDRAEATAACEAVRVALRVGDGDAGRLRERLRRQGRSRSSRTCRRPGACALMPS